MSNIHSINHVSLVSGIPKDLLRQWERRYGYPDPDRDGNGDRIYTDNQLEKLVLIRQLVDQGKRPGKLIRMDIPQLRSIMQEPVANFEPSELIEILKIGDALQLYDWLQDQLLSHGLRSFVHKVMAPATKAVGEAWAEKGLAIYEEHLFTEVIKSLARRHLSEHYGNSSGPKIMLTTVPGEQHSIGLLMVEILLRLGGANVLSFGTEMPFQEIREAANYHKVQVITLSFSASFNTEDALVMLSGLRQIIDPAIRIWVGGGAFASSPEMPSGVELQHSLTAVEQSLANLRGS